MDSRTIRAINQLVSDAIKKGIYVCDIDWQYTTVTFTDSYGNFYKITMHEINMWQSKAIVQLMFDGLMAQKGVQESGNSRTKN